MQNLLYFPMLFQLMSIGFMNILWLFEIASVDSFLSVTFLVRLNLIIAVTYEIFMTSFYGESIHQNSKSISAAVYNNKWYQMVYSSQNRNDLKQLKHFLTLTMLRGDKSVRISAGGLATINLETFMAVSD